MTAPPSCTVLPVQDHTYVIVGPPAGDFSEWPRLVARAVALRLGRCHRDQVEFLTDLGIWRDLAPGQRLVVEPKQSATWRWPSALHPGPGTAGARCRRRRCRRVTAATSSGQEISALLRNVQALRGWLEVQAQARRRGDWLVIWSELRPVPAWRPGRNSTVGRLSGAQAVAVVEQLASERYLVRRTTRAGADVRSVEVFLP